MTNGVAVKLIVFMFLVSNISKKYTKVKGVWAKHFDGQNNESGSLGDNKPTLAKM
jgi:hypothetical protein